jgi:hypothetical protein
MKLLKLINISLISSINGGFIYFFALKFSKTLHAISKEVSSYIRIPCLKEKENEAIRK